MSTSCLSQPTQGSQMDFTKILAFYKKSVTTSTLQESVPTSTLQSEAWFLPLILSIKQYIQ